MIHRMILASAATALVLTSGCRHCCRFNERSYSSTPFKPLAPNTPILLPPAGVPTTPGGAAPSVVPGVGPSAPGDTRNFSPPSGGPAPEVLFPDPLPGSGSSRSASPGNAGSSILGGPVRPQVTESPRSAAIQPGGIAGFEKVKSGIASGRKPSLEGFDALKQAGYRTVVYLHASGADVSAVRTVVEKRSLHFVAIETTPEGLVEALKQFNATISDTSPVFVFDDDGVRAGAMWYLYFRSAEAMNDDAARIRARPLGYTDQGDEARSFSLSIQRYLETR